MMFVLSLPNFWITEKKEHAEFDNLLDFEPTKITNSGQSAV